MEISSRKEAKAKGLPHYFTGKPCKHGHVAKRSVANATCLVCASNTQKKYKKNNPEYQAFMEHRYNASIRGVEFLFTFEEWDEFWGEKLEFRGDGADGLMCARYYDCGPYSAENCYITTVAENTREFATGNYQEPWSKTSPY